MALRGPGEPWDLIVDTAVSRLRVSGEGEGPKGSGSVRARLRLRILSRAVCGEFDHIYYYITCVKYILGTVCMRIAKICCFTNCCSLYFVSSPNPLQARAVPLQISSEPRHIVHVLRTAPAVSGFLSHDF